MRASQLSPNRPAYVSTCLDLLGRTKPIMPQAQAWAYMVANSLLAQELPRPFLSPKCCCCSAADEPNQSSLWDAVQQHIVLQLQMQLLLRFQPEHAGAITHLHRLVAHLHGIITPTTSVAGTDTQWLQRSGSVQLT